MKTIDYENIDLQGSCLSGLCEYFEVSKLEALGREVKFVERSSSKLSAWAFLRLNTCLIHNGKEMSLNEMAGEL